MTRISPLLFLILVSFTDHVGCIVLTSSPLTATDGELFTLICSNNTSVGQSIQWFRNEKSIFFTTQFPHGITLSDRYAFNTYLSGRVNVSSDVRHHNVTLRINSTIDRGSRWQCLYNLKSEASCPMTINVMEPQTTLDTITTRSTPVITTTTEDKYLPDSTDCTVSQTATSPTSTHSTTVTTSISTTKRTPISTNGETASSGQDTITAIAAGAAGGGVAVIALVIVVAACIMKRRRSVEGLPSPTHSRTDICIFLPEDGKDKTRRDRIPSKSAEMLIESGDKEDEERVMQDNIIYTSSSDVAPADYKILDHNPAVTDVYTQVKKAKKHGDQHVVTDVYAKPNKGGKHSCNTDVYAKVNKVKKTTSDQPKDTSENIEDMYAKPQKKK